MKNRKAVITSCPECKTKIGKDGIKKHLKKIHRYTELQVNQYFERIENVPVEVGTKYKVNIEAMTKDGKKGIAYIRKILRDRWTGTFQSKFIIMVSNAKVGENCEIEITGLNPKFTCAFGRKITPPHKIPPLPKSPTVKLNRPRGPLPEKIVDSISPQCSRCYFLRGHHCGKGLNLFERDMCHGFQKKF